MRVVIEKATGRILEAQPYAQAGAMLDAIVAGGQFRDNELEEVFDQSAPADLSLRYYNRGRWDLKPTVQAAQDAKPIKEQIAAIEAEVGFTRKQREAMAKGDNVVTAGGIYGRIAAVQDTTFLIEIDNGVKIRVDKNSVYPSAADAQASQQQAN